METLIDLVRTGATRFDRRPALMIRPFFRTRTWRYRDLGGDRAACRAASSPEAGLVEGDRVNHLGGQPARSGGSRSSAIAHAGGVAVPLDVRHTGRLRSQDRGPDRRQARRREPSDARRRRAQLGLADRVDRDAARPGPARRRPCRRRRSTGATLAEIVFTSGTTGEPKGAMLSHGNLIASATAMTRCCRSATEDRLLSVLPLSHLYEQVLGFIGAADRRARASSIRSAASRRC